MSERSVVNKQVPGPTPFSNVSAINAPYQPPHKRVTPTEIEERRSKGLCFWCDEKYTFSHKCASKHLFTLILEPEEEGEDVTNEEEAGEIN